MPQVKLTKNNLKLHRDALKRFQRYLPTLQLKKQQLQLEVRKLEIQVEEKHQEEETERRHLQSWSKLYSEPFDFEGHVELTTIHLSEGNIAGVAIPILDDLSFKVTPPDLFNTPLWVDHAIQVLQHLTRLRAERLVLHQQQACLEEELRITNQRVNLFEKVKIPESKEAIRKINIFLGDQQTAAVARAKIAKTKTVLREAQTVMRGIEQGTLA